MKRHILILIALVLALSSFAQRITYKDYRDISVENYSDSIQIERYSPFAAGLLNGIIPPFGYVYVEEYTRALAVFGGQLLCMSLTTAGAIIYINDAFSSTPSNKGAPLLYFGMTSAVALYIWSIADVVKIAKVKNLAYQERNISMMLRPSLMYNNMAINQPLTYGISLSFSF